MRKYWALGLVLLLAGAVQADKVLYDGDNPLDVRMDEYPWRWNYTATNGGVIGLPYVTTHDAAGGATVLDTIGDYNSGYKTYAERDKAGYYSDTNMGLPVFDRTTGFTLQFSLRLEHEYHQNNDRAGFSILLLDEMHKGVELAFWMNEIWAQNDDSKSASDLFTHGEGVAFDTTAARTSYNLVFYGEYYSLFIGDDPDNLQRILYGKIRDYSNWTYGTTGLSYPYDQTRFIFMGDNTSSAMAVTEIEDIALIEHPVPEPVSLALLATGCAGILLRRRR